MKNLKKTLAVVLAFAMILSMGFSAFAYTDVAEGTKVAEAVGILSNLNIFTGFEDGTFKPDDTVTRAQMAAIICRTLGYEDQAVASTGTTNFYDVAASHWASGYINVAESLQIVNGYGNGAFGPEDQVTYEQAIKMIVVALGYELDAQAKGGWSTGYLAVAAREGITKNSNGVVGSPAARGTIAVLVYNSLEVRLMDQDTWTTSGKEDEYKKLDETILSQYLGIRKVEGIVESTPFNDYAKGYTADKEAKIKFFAGAGEKKVGAAVYFEYDEGKLKSYTLSELEYDASLVPEANSFAGKKVVAYVGEEEDDETGAYMVYAIAEKQGANKVTTISSAQLPKAADLDASEDKVISYKEVGSSRTSEIDLDDNVLVSVNFAENKSLKTVAKTKDLVDFFATEKCAGIVTLISNDSNSKIDVVAVTLYNGGEAVVEDAKTEDGIVVFDLYKGKLDSIDTEDEDVLNFVIKDGVVATVADIAANDTVSTVSVAADYSFNLYYVSSKTVTGKVSSYDDDDNYVEIGGEEYEVSSKYGKPSDLAKKEGIFFLNVDGQVAYAEATAAVNYGIIYGAGPENSRKFAIDVVLADGTTATYELKDKLTYNESKTPLTDEDVVKELAKLMNDKSYSGKWEVAEGDDITGLVFDIVVKDGVVKELTPLKSDYDDTKKEYDEENMSYGSNIEFNDSTVIVSVKTKDDVEVEAGDIKIGKVTDYFVDGEGEDFALWAYDVDENSNIAGLVVGKNLSATIIQDGSAFIYTGKSSTEIDDEEAYTLKGYQAGKAVSYTILADDATAAGVTISSLKKGDVLLLGAANADGMITDLEVIFTAGQKADGAGKGTLATKKADKDGEYTYYGKLDESFDPTDSKFKLTIISDDYKDADDKFTTAFADSFVTMKNAANYTLVDFSESATPEVSRKSKGSSIFNRYEKNYDYDVVVRYFDDAQVDVIVYRYAQPQA